MEAVIVSHTHWDREWYLPFQQFRARLVALIDYVIDLLEHNDRFKCFTLDGQSVVLEDYLEVRPENEERLRRLIRDGRLFVGPWYVLPDEFLSTGETIVRNLLVGRKVARRFGRVMNVGYVPDPFGHTGQLPQILRGFGIGAAIFSRGMGDEAEELGAEFSWRSPDGSEVLGLWLPAHYGNFVRVGSFNPWALDERFSQGCARTAHAGDAVRHTRDLVGRLAMRSRSGVVLLDAGSDHLAPRADLPEIVSALQGALDEAGGQTCGADCGAGSGEALRVCLVQGSFEDYVEKMRERTCAQGLTLGIHEGEFRGSRYENMLYSVLSSRMPLKQLNYDTDSWLTRYAEPLACAAWLLSGQDYPKSLLDLAWKLYLHNQAHDSICGCSTDEVAAEMVARYTQAREIAIAVATESLASIASKVKTLGPDESAVPVLVYNPNPWPASGTVRVHIPVERIATSCPAPGPCSSGAAEDTSDGAGWYAVADGAGRVVGAQVLGAWGQAAASDADCGRVLAESASCAAGAEGEGRPGRSPRLVATPRELAGDPSAVLCDKVRRGEPAVSLAFPARDLPAMGYRVYFVSSGRGDLRARGLSEVQPQVVVGDDSLENEFLKVTVSSCGAIYVLDKRTDQMYPGLNVFEDSGDAGDEYDYSPVEDEPILTAGAAARVVVEEPGPYIGSLGIEIRWEIPAALDPGRRRRSRNRVPLDIVSHVTLAGNAPYVAIRTEVDNAARDHRLRVLFPTGAKADHVFAEGQFDVVMRAARPHYADDWFQPQAPVAPHQGFVDAGDGARGLAVVTRGLPEYECLKGASGEATIAVTLLRCVGWLSRNDLITRKGYAGPPIFVPGAQCPDKHGFEYAVIPHAGSWSEAGISRAARRFISPLLAYLASKHTGGLPTEASLLEADSGAVMASAVKKTEDGDGLVVRLCNPGDRPVAIRLVAGVPVGRAYLADLEEKPIKSLMISDTGRAVQVDLGAKKIGTVILSLGTPSHSREGDEIPLS